MEYDDWNTRIGILGLEYQDWNTRIGIPGLEYQDWNTRIGIPGLENQDWNTRIGIPGLEYQDWNTRIGIPGLEQLAGHQVMEHCEILYEGNLIYYVINTELKSALTIQYTIIEKHLDKCLQ